MKVKLKSAKHSGWLNIDKVYTVLSIGGPLDNLYYRLKSEQDDGPALFPIGDFSVVCKKIPSVWEITLESGILELSPKEWSADGFWEEYFDGKKYAIETYQRILSILESCS